VVKIIVVLISLMAFSAVASIPKSLTCVNEPTIEDQVTGHYKHCLSDKLSSIEIYMGFFELLKCQSSGGIDNLKYIKCLNKNFATIGKRMNLPLDKCYNDLIRAPHMKYYLTTLFKACVSRNFSGINRKIESATF
jgi:hypothetical protein